MAKGIGTCPIISDTNSPRVGCSGDKCAYWERYSEDTGECYITYALSKLISISGALQDIAGLLRKIANPIVKAQLTRNQLGGDKNGS